MTDIDLDQTEGALKDGGAAVVDVREPAEYAEGHVPGVVHIPMAQLPARAAELDREQACVRHLRFRQSQQRHG